VVSWIDPEMWNGIEDAFTELHPVKENYPATFNPPRDLLSGITHPDRWGHYRLGHKMGRYNHIWRRIEKQYDREVVALLQSVYGSETEHYARKITPWQKFNYCNYVLHNSEGAARAIDEMCEIAFQAGFEDATKRKFRPPPSRRRKRFYRCPIPKTYLVDNEERSITSLKDLFD
jgi:hypothetical protein